MTEDAYYLPPASTTGISTCTHTYTHTHTHTHTYKHVHTPTTQIPVIFNSTKTEESYCTNEIQCYINYFSNGLSIDIER
jgi:hypothetical protein